MFANNKIRNGLTLAEVVISTLLVGVVLVGAMSTLGNVHLTRRNAVDLQVGPCLAGELMNEILQKPFTDPDTPSATIGTDSGESSTPRNQFDDIDDYHNWSTTNLVRPDGSALGYGSGWSREVEVTHVNIDTLTASGSETRLKQIIVTATSPSGRETVLKALRSYAGCLERLPSKDQSYVAGTRISLQTSNLGTDTVIGTAIKNHGVDQ